VSPLELILGFFGLTALLMAIGAACVGVLTLAAFVCELARGRV
jgi:hypothetical protein